MSAETVGSVILWLIVLAIVVVIAVPTVGLSALGRDAFVRTGSAAKVITAAALSSCRSCTRSRR